MIAAMQIAAGTGFIVTGVWMAIKKSCAPLKRKHRGGLTIETERKLALVSAFLLITVGTVFFVLAWLTLFVPDIDDLVVNSISLLGIGLPAILELLAIRRFNGTISSRNS